MNGTGTTQNNQDTVRKPHLGELKRPCNGCVKHWSDQFRATHDNTTSISIAVGQWVANKTEMVGHNVNSSAKTSSKSLNDEPH